MFVYCKAKSVHVTTSESLVWSLDGEESEPVTSVDIKNLHSNNFIIALAVNLSNFCYLYSIIPKNLKYNFHQK